MSQDKMDMHIGKNVEERYKALIFLAVSLTVLFTVFYIFG
jgi:hypothetical protein